MNTLNILNRSPMISFINLHDLLEELGRHWGNIVSTEILQFYFTVNMFCKKDFNGWLI